MLQIYITNYPPPPESVVYSLESGTQCIDPWRAGHYIYFYNNNQCVEPIKAHVHRITDEMGVEQQLVTTSRIMMLGAKKIQEFLKFLGHEDYAIDHFMHAQATEITPLSIAFRTEQRLEKKIKIDNIKMDTSCTPVQLKIFSDQANACVSAINKLELMSIDDMSIQNNCFTLTSPDQISTFLRRVCKFHKNEIKKFMKSNHLDTAPLTTAETTTPTTMSTTMKM